MSLKTAQIRTPNNIPNTTAALSAENARRAAVRGTVNPQQALAEQLRRDVGRAQLADRMATSRQAQQQLQSIPSQPRKLPVRTSPTPAPYTNRLPTVNRAYQPGANYNPSGASSIAARNAAAAAGATGAQANAAARAAVPRVITPAMAARGALGASPLIGAGIQGASYAGYAKANGGSWWEAAGAGLGAAVGSSLGTGLGLAAGLTTANPVVAAGAPIAGSIAGASIGALTGAGLARGAGAILGRIPGAGGAVAKLAGAVVPGAGLLYAGASLLDGWLQPETVAGGAIPSATETVYGEPPFTGGQSPGVNYRIRYSVGGTPREGVIPNLDVYGPVSGLSRVEIPGPGPSGEPYGVTYPGTVRTSSGGSVQVALNLGGAAVRWIANSGEASRFNVTGLTVTPWEGQPDTGGDQLGPPTTQPATSKPRPYNPFEAPPRSASPETVPAGHAPAPSNDASQAPAIRPSAPPADAPAAPDPSPALPAGDPLAAPAPASNPTANPDPTAAPTATPANIPKKATPEKTIQPALQPGQTITLSGGTTITGTETGYKISSPTDSPNTIKLPNGQTLLPGESSFLEGLLNPALAPLLAIPALAIPALLATPTATTGKVGDPTTPGNFTQAPPITPTSPVPTPPDNGCRCNGPILANQAAQAAELATLLAELERIKAAIGVHGLPASVPNQIAKKAGGQRMVNSLAELHLWQVEQLDGVVGQWPIEIGVDTPGGNVGLTIPNMAEAMSEQMGLLIGQQVTSAQILNTASRTLAQSGSATQQAHLAHLTAKANADFLGYESRSNAVDMPLAYTPGKNPFDGLLNESTAKVLGFENTDGTDIKAILAELLQAAAIIRAVYWRKLDTKGDLKTQIRGNLRGQGDFLDKAAAGDGNDSDWEDYLRQVAEGFKGLTGDANPYNRPPTEGPQIKDRSPGKDGK